jgi:hypothetical protein
MVNNLVVKIQLWSKINIVVTNKTFKKLAMSFPGTATTPHFYKIAFRIKKKIWATLYQTKKSGLL